jgi:hypothetical protein
VQIPRAPLRLLLFASTLACAACPGTLEDPGRFTEGGVCADVPSTLFATTCAKSGCHSSTDRAQQLDLESPDVASRLVGISATEGVGLLIDPSNPAMSVLYTKLTMVPPFGSRMPLGGAPVDDATLSCVLAWITANGEDASVSDDGSTGGGSESGGADAGAGTGVDASADAGGGAAEAGPREAGARDAAAADAGARDAGHPDASFEVSSDASDASAGG